MKREIMTKKRILIIVIVILMVLFVIGYIYNLEDKHQLTNNSYNTTTTTDFQINNNTDKNFNLNNNSTSDNKTHDNYNKVKLNNKNNKKEPNKTHDDALLAKEIAEKCAIDNNEIAGFPVYKDKRMDAWLVPIFDKHTGKFKTSVFVHYKKSAYFVEGIDNYHDYKELVYGKKIKHNSKSSIDKTKVNKSNKTMKNKNTTNKSTKNNNVKSSLKNSSTLKSKLT